MAMAVALLSIMDMLVKVLVTAGHGVFQIMALRSAVILVLFIVLLPRWGGLSSLRPARPAALLARSLAGAAGALLFFASFRSLPLADATALAFGAPFAMTALSAPLLKEHIGRARWLTVAVGFLGVLIVTRPGGTFEPAVLYAIGGSFGYALMMVLGRWLGTSEPLFRQVFHFNLVLGVVALPVAAADWRPMAADDIGLLGLLSLLAFAGHFCLTAAFVRAPVGVVAPFEYTALAWAAALGYLVWGHVPEPAVLGGSAIIVASGLYILHQESRHPRPAGGDRGTGV